jgi:hypothetical protein
VRKTTRQYTKNHSNDHNGTEAQNTEIKAQNAAKSSKIGGVYGKQNTTAVRRKLQYYTKMSLH